MCECVPPPPLFDLPPPPDPSLIWRELAHYNNDSEEQIDADVRAFERFFHEPAGSCAWLDRHGPSGSIDEALLDSDGFWTTGFGSDKNVNRLYYLLSAVFVVLFITCCAAIFALRSRATNKRLKRSTPSLNSSKLSTETVGTATATMVASVGSGRRSAGAGASSVATLINNNNNNNNNGCRLPQMYHSATISRRTFAPPPGYCIQYPTNCHNQQGQLTQPPYTACSSGQTSCCGCATPSCCFDEQQRRIYSSQSATNIFSNIFLAPSQQQQQQQHKQHIQCMNNNGQLSNYVHQQSQPYFLNNTVVRPRCAALRVQNQPPQLSLLPQLTNPQFLLTANCAAGAWTPQTQRSAGYSSATPYDYEEIVNPTGGSQLAPCHFAAADDTDNTTIFEDLSENLRQLEARQSQRSQQRLPPPVRRPPPIPFKRQLTADTCQRSANVVTYQVPPLATDHALTSPSASSVDAELENIENCVNSYSHHNVQKHQQEEEEQQLSGNEIARSDSCADRTCDDVTSLASAADANETNYVRRSNNGPASAVEQSRNDTIVTTAANAPNGGRESGYGTGKSRQYVTTGEEISPPLRLTYKGSVAENVNCLPNGNNSLSFQKGNGQDPPPYHHVSPTMTYV